jgi:predicted aspartyl protease
LIRWKKTKFTKLSYKPEIKISISNGEIGLELLCLLDTGCSKTVISNRLVNSINPDLSNNKGIISTVHGESSSNMYIVYIIFDGHSKAIRTDVGSHDNLKGYDVIIGMDIIEDALFIINKGILSFDIDYLK